MTNIFIKDDNDDTDDDNDNCRQDSVPETETLPSRIA